jgi:hypothetical protein
MAAVEFNAAIKTADQTLAAVEAAVCKNAEDWRRPHLGASQIGRSCTAALWWSFRWASAPGHRARTLRLFARGQREEDSLAGLLRAAGLTVVQEDPQTGAQFRFSDGHFGGSMDGAVNNLPESKAWHVLEFKTAGRKSFDQLVKTGVEKAQPAHYAQMQCYMHWSGMRRALYVSVCKDDDRLHLERIDYDNEVAERYIRRAQDIIASDAPMERVSDDATWYECKWCEHHAVCHGVRAPQVSCRTCTHITFGRDGSTTCALWQADIPVGGQRAGCDRHLYNPAMLRNWAEPVDASEQGNWIRYQLLGRSGDFINGQGEGRFSSPEIEAAGSPDNLVDPNLLALRSEFDGRLVAS